jgi:hypothetical protein
MTHPMITSLGEEKFLEVLSAFPQAYEDKYNGNYKPVCMTLMWMGHIYGFDIPEGEAMDWVAIAQNEWKNGATLEGACRMVVTVSEIINGKIQDIALEK